MRGFVPRRACVCDRCERCGGPNKVNRLFDKTQLAVTVSAATAHWAASAAVEEAGEVVGVTTVHFGTSNSEGVRRRAFIRPFRAPSSVSSPSLSVPFLALPTRPESGTLPLTLALVFIPPPSASSLFLLSCFVAFSRSALRCALVQNQRAALHPTRRRDGSVGSSWSSGTGQRREADRASSLASTAVHCRC